ncbi:MAG: response regulator [Comamonadaceae bacterium]|nr:response regulator [Comamonadaceae bacterium]
MRASHNRVGGGTQGKGSMVFSSSESSRLIDLNERGRHVRAASSIGLVVALLFSVLNIVLLAQPLLGWIELATSLLLVAPAVVISRQQRWVSLAESLLLSSSVVIFSALIALGGVEGTGLFWVYTLPFLAFFLKGQRLGWIFSLIFWVWVTLYFLVVETWTDLPPVHSNVVRIQFLLSLAFYILVAAAFNHVRGRFEASLQQRKDQAEAAYQAKSRFLASASHDLRQPAHALGMFVARLSQLPYNPQTQVLVAGVEASVKALQDMLESFFDYSRLDAPSMQVRVQAFAVNLVLAQLRTGFEGMAAQKGLRLRIRPSRLWLTSDPILLHRVLLNLVSNAVQHTHRGSILVACRPCQGFSQARIEVWDSGIGIAAEHHSMVFEEFFQVGNPERDRAKGLGLGLSIVARSCQLLNHPVKLCSTLGRGTRFTVQVPLATEAPAPTPTDLEPAPLADLKGLRVILIEDDVLGRQALRGMLESWGCTVRTAEHTHAARDALTQMPAPDFILSDFRLPGQFNGIQAVQMLRQALGHEVAACVISGDTDNTVRQQVLAAGLVLLQKPVRPAKLRSVLRRSMIVGSMPVADPQETEK